MDPQGSTWIHTPHHARTRTRTPHSPHSPLSPHTQPSMALTRALVRLHTRVVSGAIYAFNVAALVACLAAAVAEDALRCRLDRRQKGRFYVGCPDLGLDSEPARFVARIEEVTGATGLVWWVRGRGRLAGPHPSQGCPGLSRAGWPGWGQGAGAGAGAGQGRG